MKPVLKYKHSPEFMVFAIMAASVGFEISISVPVGTSPEETKKMTKKLERLKADYEFEKVLRKHAKEQGN